MSSSNSPSATRVIGNINCKEGKGENQFTQPRGICLNYETKELFVVDCNNHRIQVFHLQSQAFIRQIGKGVPGNGSGSLMYPVGICMDHDNHIYVADTNNHRIVKFNHLTGTFIKSYGSQGNGPGSFNCPYGLCIDHQKGELYVADYENNRIQVVDKEDGTFIRFIGRGPGQLPGEFHQPIDVCLDEDNQTLLVADYSNNRIQVFDQLTGEFKAMIGGSAADINCFSGPRSVYINKASGLLFAADRENHRIQLYNKNTFEFIRHIGLGLGTNVNQFNRPMELCVDDDTGTLIVVDGYNHRVQIIELPELQKEKLRLQMVRRHESELVLKVPTSVSPSSLAVSLLLSGNTTLRVATLLQNWYTVAVKKGLVNYRAIVQSDNIDQILQDTKKCSRTDLNLDMGSEIQSRTAIMNAMDMQGNLFSKMLDNLIDFNTSQEGECIGNLLAPTLAAMQSLVWKDWIPGDLSHNSIKTLFLVMSTPDSAGVTPLSTSRACLDILKGYIHAGSTQQDFLLGLLEQNFCRLSRFKFTADNQMANAEAIQSLLHSFELLNHLIQFKINCKHIAIQSSSGSTLQHSYNRWEKNSDSLQMLFGTIVSQSLECDVMEVASNPIDSSKRTVPILPSISSLFTSLDSFCAVIKNLIDLDTVQSMNSMEDYRKCRYCFLDRTLQHLNKLDKNQLLKFQNKEKKSRGGRNIWDPVYPLAIGDLIDCMDKEKVWFESVVVDLLPDNGVKVHFMGWGSKWDDVVSKAELNVRIAPLNSKTVNWRSELFEGGLIEIKCNDDLVNQKWMWGRVRKLNLDESWVEIVYSFSNEPTVIKRAWLYGETICPVGMHTKDKSKNAAASIVKPGKSVDQIIQERLMKKENVKELTLFDYEDNFCEDHISSGYQKILNTESSKSSKLESLSVHPIIEIAQHYFDSVLREVVFTIADRSSTELAEINPSASMNDTKMLNELLGILYRTLSPKVFLDRIVKAIYFQAAIHAKTIAAPYYKSSTQNVVDWNEVMILSTKLSTLFSKYAENISECFNNILSFPTIKFIQERIRSTINRCGFTPLANEVIHNFSKNSSLLRETMGPLILSQKFSSSLMEVRKFFHTIVLSAGDEEIKILMALIEEEFVQKEVLRLFTSKSQQTCTFSHRTWSNEEMKELVEKVQFYNHLKNTFSNKFIIDHPQMVLMVQRVAFLISKKMSTSTAKSLAYELANGFHWILSKSDSNQVHSNSATLPNSPIAFLETLVEMYQLFHHEEFSFHFEHIYFNLFASRLLDTSNSSLVIEGKVLQSLSLHLKGQPLLEDVRRSFSLDETFVEYCFDAVDVDSRCEHQAHDLKDAMTIISNNGFSVMNCTQSRWPYLKLLDCATELNLPNVMTILKNTYNKFFYTNNSKRAVNAQRLSWCFGFGRVTLQAFFQDHKKRILQCDELQAAILIAIAGDCSQSVSVASLSAKVGLSLDVTIEVVQLLIRDEILFAYSPTQISRSCDMKCIGSTILSLNTDFFSENKGPHSSTSNRVNYDDVERSAERWNTSRVDAAILRCLKSNPSNPCEFSFICSYVRSKVSNMKDLSDQVIYDRCHHLYQRGIISKDCMSLTDATQEALQSEMFSYMPLHTTSASNHDGRDFVVNQILSSMTNQEVASSLRVETFSNESKKDSSTPVMEESVHESLGMKLIKLVLVKQPLLFSQHPLSPDANLVSQLCSAGPQILMAMLVQVDAAIRLSIDSKDWRFRLPLLNNVLASIKYRRWDFKVVEQDFLFNVFQLLPTEAMQAIIGQFQLVVECGDKFFSTINRSTIDTYDIRKEWHEQFPWRLNQRRLDNEKKSISLGEFFTNFVMQRGFLEHSLRKDIQEKQDSSKDHRSEEKDSQECSVDEGERESVNGSECPPIPTEYFPTFGPQQADDNELEEEIAWFDRARSIHSQLLESPIFSRPHDSNEKTAMILMVQLEEALQKSLICLNSNCTDSDGLGGLLSIQVKIHLGCVLVDNFIKQCPKEILDCIWWFDSSSSSLEEVVSKGLSFFDSYGPNYDDKRLHKLEINAARMQFFWDFKSDFSQNKIASKELFFVVSSLEELLRVHWSTILKLLPSCSWDAETLIDCWFSKKYYEIDWSCSYYSGKALEDGLGQVSNITNTRICESCHQRTSLKSLYCPQRCVHYACQNCWVHHFRKSIHEDSKLCCINANCDTSLDLDFITEISGKDIAHGWLASLVRNSLSQYYSWISHSAIKDISASALNSESMECLLCHDQAYFCHLLLTNTESDRNHQNAQFRENEQYRKYIEYFHKSSKGGIECTKVNILRLAEEIKQCEQEDYFSQLLQRHDYFQLSLECEYLINHLDKSLDEEVIDAFALQRLQILFSTITDEKTNRLMHGPLQNDCVSSNLMEVASRSIFRLRYLRQLLLRRLEHNRGLSQSLSWNNIRKPTWSLPIDSDNISSSPNSMKLRHTLPFSTTLCRGVVFGEFSTNYLEIGSVNTIPQLVDEMEAQRHYVKTTLDQLHHFEELPRDPFLELIWQLKDSLQSFSITMLSIVGCNDLMASGSSSLYFSFLPGQQLEVILSALDYASSDTDAFSMLLECLQIYLQGRYRYIEQCFIRNNTSCVRNSLLKTLRKGLSEEKQALESLLHSAIDLLCTALDIYNYQYRVMSMQCVRTLKDFVQLLSCLRQRTAQLCQGEIDVENNICCKVDLVSADNQLTMQVSTMKHNLTIDSANLLIAILLKERNYYSEEAMEFLSSSLSSASTLSNTTSMAFDDVWSCLNEHNLVSHTMIAFINECNSVLLEERKEKELSSAELRRVASDDRFWMEFAVSLSSLIRCCCLTLPKQATHWTQATIDNLAESSIVVCDVVVYILTNHRSLMYGTVSNWASNSSWMGTSNTQPCESEISLQSFLLEGMAVLLRHAVAIVRDHNIIDRLLLGMSSLFALHRGHDEISLPPSSIAAMLYHASRSEQSIRSEHISKIYPTVLNKLASKEFVDALLLLLSKSLARFESNNNVNEVQLTMSRLSIIAKTLSEYFAACGANAINLCLENISLLPTLLRRREDLREYFRSTSSVLEKSDCNWSQYYLDTVIQDLRNAQYSQVESFPVGTARPSSRSPGRSSALEMIENQPSVPTPLGPNAPRREAIHPLVRRQTRPRRAQVNQQDNIQPMMRAFLDHLLLDRVLMDLNNTLQRGATGVGAPDQGTDAQLTMAAMMLMQQGQDRILHQEQDERDDSSVEIESHSDSSASSLAEEHSHDEEASVLEVGEDGEEIMNLQLLDFRFNGEFPPEDDV